ncbi:MAG: TIM barrel protein [Promethearchaeota archaeon]
MYQIADLRYQREAAGASREELLRRLRSFKLQPKFSVGVWYFSPGGGRFHERYVPEMDVPARLQLAKEMADLGVTGIEAHYPAEINEDNVDLYKDLEGSAGIRVVGIPFSHFYEKEFEFGALSNPDPKVRERAIEVAEGALRLVKELGAAVAISWPGIDGYAYSLGTFYNFTWNWYEESIAEAMDRVPGVRVALEPKPYEPAPNNIYRTTAEGILAAQGVEARLRHPENRRLLEEGHALFALNPEVGHVRMGFEPVAAAFALVGRHGRLAHTHWNSQPLGNYDQDLNVGVVGWEDTFALLYALKAMGYREYFGIDVNPERMPVTTAVELNVRAVTKFAEKLEDLPHEELVDAFFDPAAHRGDVERILLDWL